VTRFFKKKISTTRFYHLRDRFTLLSTKNLYNSLTTTRLKSSTTHCRVATRQLRNAAHRCLDSSDRPELIYQPEPEPNRKHAYYFLTETETENRLKPKPEQEPKPEPKIDLNGTKNKHCYAFFL